MRFSALFLGAASLMGVMAQSVTNAPFTNSSTPSTTSTVASATSSLPSGTVATFKLTLSIGGSFTCNGGSGVAFNAQASASSGSTFSLLIDGSLKCGNFFIYVQASTTANKRQTVGPYYLIVPANAVPAGAFTTTFALSGSTLTLNNGGISFAFGLTTTNNLVAYNPANGVPAGVTAVTLVATNVVVAPASTTATPTTSGGAGAGAVSTVTATVTAVNVNVNVNVSVVIIVSSLGAPLTLTNVVAVTINGVTYYISVSTTVNAQTQTISYNGAAITGAIVIVQIVPVVVPAVQVIGGTTVTGAVTTVGTITTVQGAGAAATTTITVKAASTVSAASTVAVTAGPAVVTAGSGSTTAGSGNALPTVGRVSGANKAGMSAIAALAVVMALVL